MAEAIESVHAAARRCLDAVEPTHKLALTQECARRFAAGALSIDSEGTADVDCEAGRPALPRLVDPRQLPQRGLGSVEGRCALIHAIAHIEFNAINLAWDAVYRFRGMPHAFYADWIAVAVDEARHFALLAARLAELGSHYGACDAHDGLWEMARRTAGSCLERMALVPRVLEARGLDVTPNMIHRLRSVGDDASVAILEVILREEVAHVAAGSRWFAWCCDRAGVESETTFAALLQVYVNGSLRGPFNHAARLAAGFSAEEIARIEAMAA